MTDEPTEPLPPLRGVPGVSALMSADHQEGVEHNPEIAPLQTEFEALQTEFEALQAEFEQPKRDFEAKLDEWSERADLEGDRRRSRGTRTGRSTAAASTSNRSIASSGTKANRPSAAGRRR